MNADKSCTAQFNPAPPSQHTLSVNKTGEGSGTVTSAPAGINCGDTCSASFDEDTQVTLTASPSAGSVFASWSGDCSPCGTSSTCTITMDADKSCTAQFQTNLPPVIDSFTTNSISGTAPLTVSFTCRAHDPDGSIQSYQISYGDGETQSNTTGSFTHTYTNPGTYQAVCTAQDNEGATASSHPLTVTVTTPRFILSIFPFPTHGTVKAPEDGSQINCGSGNNTCSASFEPDSQITLYAYPDPGYQLASWSGDCSACEANSTCTLTIDTDKTCTANFQRTSNVLDIPSTMNASSFTGGTSYDSNHLELAFTRPGNLSNSVDLYIYLTQPTSQGGTTTFYFTFSSERVNLPNGIYFNQASPTTLKTAYCTNCTMPETLQLYGPADKNPVFNDGWVVPAPILCHDLPDGNYTFMIEAYQPGTENLLARGSATVTLERGCE